MVSNLSGESTGHSTIESIQALPTSDKPRYAGRVVVLINELAISHAEHSGLFLEQASKVTFVGSPTVGANGNVTWAVLPGNLSISFSGLGVRHADGRQLQRLGLQPHVFVRPTVEGLRAGRDEVLEKALAVIAQGPTTP